MPEVATVASQRGILVCMRLPLKAQQRHGEVSHRRVGVWFLQAGLPSHIQTDEMSESGP